MCLSLVLLSAFIVEYRLDHKPCRLCLYERVPYFLSLLLIAKIFLISSYEKITLLLLSLLFCAGSILALYHFGIEQGFINESFICTNKDPEKINRSNQLTKSHVDVVVADIIINEKTVFCN